jgi:exopolyphosphatase/guanosine-5'-triphosphate,3'-diphosphate pyrophosphatase
MQPILATIDLGSNSFRLLIAKINKAGLIQPIDQMKETVRLMSGFDINNNLTKTAQLIALQTLSKFNDRLHGFEKSQVRVVATSAMRIAKNSQEFIEKANKVLGFNIEIISGIEEARLIYIGAMHSISFSLDKRLVVDIGGGSTEFIIGSGYDPDIMESVTIGCLSFTDKYFVDNRLNEANFNNAILSAKVKIQAMEHLFKHKNWVSAIATSGTARAISLIIEQYQLGNNITIEALHKLKKILINFKNIDKINIESIKADRLMVLPGGLAILIAIMEELDIQDMVIVSGALREGVMYDLLGRKSDNDCRVLTVANLKHVYNLDIIQGNNVALFALHIFNQLTADENLQLLLEWACKLYELGLVISHNDYHKHGSYMLDNSDLPGFSKLEQSILADLVRSHRGSLCKVLEYLKTRRELKNKFIFSIFAFRLSVIFNRVRQTIDVNLINVILSSNKEIDIKINNSLAKNILIMHSLYEEIEQWKKIGYTINLFV